MFFAKVWDSWRPRFPENKTTKYLAKRKESTDRKQLTGAHRTRVLTFKICLKNCVNFWLYVNMLERFSKLEPAYSWITFSEGRVGPFQKSGWMQSNYYVQPRKICRVKGIHSATRLWGELFWVGRSNEGHGKSKREALLVDSCEVSVHSQAVQHLRRSLTPNLARDYATCSRLYKPRDAPWSPLEACSSTCSKLHWLACDGGCWRPYGPGC